MIFEKLSVCLYDTSDEFVFMPSETRVRKMLCKLYKIMLNESVLTVTSMHRDAYFSFV